MIHVALLVLRLGIGLTVAAHGAQKLFGWFDGPGVDGFAGWLQAMGLKPPRFWSLNAALAEFAGGLLVALGLITPIAGLVVSGSMLVAIFTVHAGKGFFSQKGGWEFPFGILLVMLAISVAGPGVFSLDQVLGIRLPEPATWAVAAILVVVGAGAALVSPRLPERTRQEKPRLA